MHQHSTTSSTRQVRHPQSVGAWLLAAFGALMIALAVGALWLLLDLAVPALHASLWLALPLGIFMGPVIRGWIIDAAMPASVMAATAMLVASAYMRLLLAATDLAGTFDIGFVQTLHRAGLPMLAQLAWMSLSAYAIGIYLLGAAIAAVLAWRGRALRRPDPSAH